MVVRVAGRAVVENAIAPTGNVVQPRHSAILQSGGRRVVRVKCASRLRSVRIADYWRCVCDNRLPTEVNDLFAEWESDPLELLSLPGLGL